MSDNVELDLRRIPIYNGEFRLRVYVKESDWWVLEVGVFRSGNLEGKPYVSIYEGFPYKYFDGYGGVDAPDNEDPGTRNIMDAVEGYY
jgi:hypothetical protein